MALRSASDSDINNNNNNNTSSSIQRPNVVSIHNGWMACRSSDGACSVGRGSSHDRSLLNVTTLPTTALLVLLDNRKINVTTSNDHSTKVTSQNLYHSNHLSLLPDIDTVGRNFYMLQYQRFIKQQQHDTTATIQVTRQTIRFAGIHYRSSSATLNGIGVYPLVVKPQHPNHPGIVDGMFRRRCYDVTDGGKFAIYVEPPLHPGKAYHATQKHNQPKQQGGDHSMAQDGPVPQFVQGWDWIQPIPDRSTGFFGPTVLHSTGPVALLDPCIQTMQISKSTIHFKVMVRLEIYNTNMLQQQQQQPQPNTTQNTASSTRTGASSSRPLCDLIVKSDWGDTWTWPVDASTIAINQRSEQQHHHERRQRGSVPPLPQATFVDLSYNITVDNIRSKNIQLWWPHDMESGPYLHNFIFQFRMRINGDDPPSVSGKLSDTQTIGVGIRTIRTYVDRRTQGQTFIINGKKIYLLGGNWITTDAAFRFSASHTRYCDEVSLHRHAGLNLIRVWGGGVAEATPFYECADRFGILVFQEFWMTGDNNGRWAGDFSWPLDNRVYLDNIEDTVMRLRRHPSLLFYGGCNECLGPSGSFNPPASINNGIEAILEQYDPGRFYIPSSMGGKNSADKFNNTDLWFNRSYSLSFADGPYGILHPATFFEQNPGLDQEYKRIPIGFQPEIGSVSFPTCKGLSRFLSQEEIDSGIPDGPNQPATGMWQYHVFESWSTAGDSEANISTYDHVYAYYRTLYRTKLSAQQWCDAAQLAAYVQYQHMMNGFLSHMFEYTTAVIVWKTQSPWPALRGFMYDWYLETTGMLRGIRSALANPVSVLLDMKTWQIKLVNRGAPYTGNAAAVGSYTWFDLAGNYVSNGSLFPSESIIPEMTTVDLNIDHDGMKNLVWPQECSDVCFLKLSLASEYNSYNDAVDTANGRKDSMPRRLNSTPTTIHNQAQRSIHTVDDHKSHQQIELNEADHSFVQWYWLTDPAKGPNSDFSPLTSTLGQFQPNEIHLQANHCSYHPATGLFITAVISIPASSESVFLYPSIALVDISEVEPSNILPLLNEDDVSSTVQIPGSSQQHHLAAPSFVPRSSRPGGIFFVAMEVSSFNSVAPTVLESIKCHMI